MYRAEQSRCAPCPPVAFTLAGDAGSNPGLVVRSMTRTWNCISFHGEGQVSLWICLFYLKWGGSEYPPSEWGGRVIFPVLTWTCLPGHTSADLKAPCYPGVQCRLIFLLSKMGFRRVAEVYRVTWGTIFHLDMTPPPSFWCGKVRGER